MSEPIARLLQTTGIALLILTFATSQLHPGVAVGVTSLVYLVGNVSLLSYVIVSPRRGGISLMLAFFFLFFVALPAYVQVDEGAFPFRSQYFDEELAGVYGVLVVAQVSYLIGEAYLDRREQECNPGPANGVLRSSFYRRAVIALIVICIAIATYLGPTVLLLTRGERGEAAGAGGLADLTVQLLFAGRSLSLLAAVTCLYLLVHDHESRRGHFPLVGVVVTAVFLTLNYPPGLSRFQLLGSALALLSVSTSFFRTSRKLLAGLVAPIFLLYVFPAIKALGFGQEVEVGGSGRGVTEYLTRVDFDAFKQIADAFLYLEDETYRWGENFLGVLLFWVPRGLWAGKPLDSGYLVSSTLGYPYTNVSSPLPAEALISFGIPGVIGVFLLLGAFCATIENRARLGQSGGELRQDVIVYALLVGFIIIILRGALNGVAPMFATGFAAYIALARMQRRLQSPTRKERDPWQSTS